MVRMKKKPEVVFNEGDAIYLKFYDHCQHEDTDINAAKRAEDTIIELYGWYEGEVDPYIYITVVKCNEKGNSTVWKILKTTVSVISKI